MLPAEQLLAQLEEVHALLLRVNKMSTLVALVKANQVREEFLRTNRDLISTFSILAQGEQLLVSILLLNGMGCGHSAGGCKLCGALASNSSRLNS
jgi:hypothetical protein